MKTLAIFIFCTFIILLGAYLTAYFEYRFSAFLGHTNYPKGRQGFILPLSNAVKMLSKLDFSQNKAEFLYLMAPIIAICPVITAFCLIASNNNENSLNIITLLALASIPVISMLFATFSAQNKSLQISAMQSVLQALNLQIPILISVLTVTILTGSLDINSIITAQSSAHGLFGWFFIPGILACATFFICILTLMIIFPFNPENTGYSGLLDYTEEYGGAKLALLLLSRHAAFLCGIILIVSLFFGGGLNPFGIWFLPNNLIFIEQFFWLSLKALIIMIALIFIKSILIKPHYKRILDFSQNILIPISLINFAIALIVQYNIGPKP